MDTGSVWAEAGGWGGGARLRPAGRVGCGRGDGTPTAPLTRFSVAQRRPEGTGADAREAHGAEKPRLPRSPASLVWPARRMLPMTLG